VTPASQATAIPTSARLPLSAGRSGALALATPGAAGGSAATNFLLVGDSVAMTLGMGLSYQSASQYGVNVADEGQLGCDLDDVDVMQSGVETPATPGCPDWRTTWPQEVNFFHPAVVGLLIGRWEVTDHLYDGQWVHVGEPAWDAHLKAELNQAIDIFSAHGARVVLFTMPYVDPSQEAADGQPFPENDPVRADAFNALLRTVAAQRSATVTLIDLNKLLDPDGTFASVIDGVTVRDSDGIHISVPGGEWLRSKILPTVASLGCAVQRSGSSPSGPGTGASRPAAPAASCIS
jgi:hypothetical protein